MEYADFVIPQGARIVSTDSAIVFPHTPANNSAKSPTFYDASRVEWNILASVASLPYLRSMNVAALIIASAFAGILLIVLVGGIAVLIFMHIRLRRENAELLANMEAFGHEVSAMIDGARSSFSGIRQEIKSGQEAQAALIAEALKLHDKNFRNTMGKLNPVALEATAVKILQASAVVGKAAQNLTLMLSGMETPPPGAADLLPEQYGPEDTIYRQSETSRLDSAAEQMDVEANAPIYGMVE